MPNRHRYRHGAIHIDATFTIFAVALFAFGAIKSFGHAGQQAIASVTKSEPREGAMVGTTWQGAIFAKAAELATFAANAKKGPDVTNSIPTELSEHFAGALTAAKEGDVLGAREALRNVLNRVSDELLQDAQFWDRIEFLEKLSYASSGRGARTLNEDQLGLLREVLSADPTMAAHIEDVIANRPELIDNVENLRRGLEVPDAFRRSREALIPFANRSDTRPLLLRSLDDDSARFTDGLWDALKDASKEEKVWDVLTIGGGVISSHAAGVLSDAVPNATQLVVEAGERAASANFTTGGGNAAIRFNQSNRGFIFGALGNFARKFANRAPLAGSVNISDLAWGKYGSTAQNWAEAGAITLRESRADVMTTTFVEGVYRAESGAPAKYRVVLRRSDDESVAVYTNKVLIGTGINVPKFPGLDDESLAIIAKERARLDVEDPTVVPRILTTAEDLYMNSIHPKWWENYGLAKRSRPDAPDAYVGVGDSVYTALTVRARGTNAPELSDLSRAQRALGISSSVDIFGGSKVPTDPQAFLLGDGTWPGLRARYADIYPNIVRAKQQFDAGEPLGPETFLLRSERVKKVRVTDSGLIELTSNEGSVGLYNRVIFGTGSESNVGALIADFVDPKSYIGEIQDSGKLDVVDPEGNTLRPDEVGMDDRGAARRVPGEDIYVIGLSAGGDIIPNQQLAGIKENSAAVANWAERVERLVVSTKTIVSGLSPVRPKSRNKQPVKINPGDAPDATTSIPWANVPDLRATDRVALIAEKQPMIALKYELARAFEDYRFQGGDGSLAIIFERAADKQGNAQLRIRSNFESDQWSKALESNPRLLGLLKRLLRRERPLAVIADTYSEASEAFGFERGTVRTKTIEVFGG